MEKPATTDDIQSLRSQLQQLQQLHASGALDDTQYQQSKERLERRLLDAVVQGAPVPAAAPATATPAAEAVARPSRRLWAGVSAFVLVVAVAGYAWKGSPDRLTTTAADQAAAGDGAAHDTNAAQIAAMVDKLAQRMKEHPEDATGWVMLARSYFVLERYAEALPAFQQALKLAGDDPDLLADYADALGVVNNRQLGPDSLAMIERALSLDAKHLKALSLAGSAAFTSKDYAGAVRYWDRLVAAAPADSPYLSDVRAGIAQARELGKLGNAPVAPVAAAVPAAQTTPVAQNTPPAAHAGKSPTPPAAGGAATVSGTVTLSKALAAQASPNDTVFIFARAAEGPRMPLAILRKQVKDLPLEFKLDDSMAMAPAMKLSAFPKVIVGARISKSGEAMPQKGDLSGSSAAVPVGTSGLKIEIDQVLNP